MNINKSFITKLSFIGKETTYFDDTAKGFGVCEQIICELYSDVL